MQIRVAVANLVFFLFSFLSFFLLLKKLVG